ncbi:MAG: hypothetical protein FRX49_00459 [Trebouxia sp. A1-2]|nr:MAG: hypothetical protein FRX49_00459 [Trebouxia sp. A1-2]
MPPRRSGRLKLVEAPCLASKAEVSDSNKKRVSINCLPDALLLQVLASTEPCQAAERRNSSADTTHSFAHNGRSLGDMFKAVAGGLQSLEVDNCNDIFTQSTFEDLPMLTQLKKLHISNCRKGLLSSSFDCLRSLSNLQDLKIAGDTDYENVLTLNCLSSFPTALFRLTNLTSLSLSSRGLTDIPSGISTLTQLQKLTLDGCNNLKPLPALLCSIKSLQELSLTDIAGSLVVDSIRNFTLEKLSLRKSGVHVLGVGLTNCTIKQLDVSHNAFAGNAPGLIDKYQHLGLEVLNLNSCALDTLPAGINAFTALKVLDLGYNGMVDLPDSMSSLTHLECLNLQGNCFPILPQAVQKLKSLCCLSLVACNYLEIPCWDAVAFFAKWPRLRTIWMWKTDGVEYQNYSKAALQQLKTKLKRKRTRDSTLCYEMQGAPDMRNIELIMHGLTSSLTLST